MSNPRTRWAAIGAAVAVTLGAGGISLGHAAIGSGDRSVFVAVEPCRLVDTRPGDANVGVRTSPLGANDTLVLQVTGSSGECSGIPAGASAAAMNVTAIQGSTQSFLSVYPADAELPNASNLNWRGGDPPTPNKVDVKLSPAGAVNLTNAFGTVHIAADLVGYYIDHHHDDRYYTKAQIDGRRAAEILAFGRLLSSNTLNTAFTADGVSVTASNVDTGIVELRLVGHGDGPAQLSFAPVAGGSLIVAVACHIVTTSYNPTLDERRWWVKCSQNGAVANTTFDYTITG